MKKLLMGGVFSLFAVMANPVLASSWNYASAGNDSMKFYFDADSIEKAKGVVTVWIKIVYTGELTEEGVRARAMRWRINCTKKTIQRLTASTYDDNGKFISSTTSAGTEDAVIPDSTGEAMQKIACEPTFPNDKSNPNYFKLESNDVYQATKNLVDYEKSKKDTAPQ